MKLFLTSASVGGWKVSHIVLSSKHFILKDFSSQKRSVVATKLFFLLISSVHSYMTPQLILMNTSVFPNTSLAKTGQFSRASSIEFTEMLESLFNSKYHL